MGELVIRMRGWAYIVFREPRMRKTMRDGLPEVRGTTTKYDLQ